jgi:GT2 family glycosyltransferase
MRQKVAVITINFNGLADTLECLDSLQEAKKKADFDVIVVHYQAENDREKLNTHPITPLIIPSNENLGFAGFNNLALQSISPQNYSHVVLLNNDTTVDSNFLRPLLQALEDSSVAFASPKIYFYPGKEFHQDYPSQYMGKVLWYAGGVIDWQNMLLFHRGVDEVDRGQFDTLAKTDFATGCCMAFKTTLLDKVGFMPNDYFMYYEDAAWCQRARQRSLQSVYVPESNVFHKNASSTGGSGSPFHEYYQTINRFRFAQDFAPVKTRLLLIKHHLKQMLTGTKQERMRSLHAMLKKNSSTLAAHH